jgi:RNA polymerase sigma-70 factor (ECF subfamily)
MENRRGNDDWINQLRASKETQAIALEDLRRILLGGLLRAFPSQHASDLEDAAQIALVRILDHLDSFAGESRFTTWSMAIAVRITLSDRRRKKWQHVSLEDAAKDPENSPPLAEAPGADPAKCTAQNNLATILRDVINEVLTSKQRDAILAEVNGMPLEEIASRLGSNLNAVYKLLHDARKRLKSALEERGVHQEDVAQTFST